MRQKKANRVTGSSIAVLLVLMGIFGFARGCEAPEQPAEGDGEETAAATQPVEGDGPAVTVGMTNTLKYDPEHVTIDVGDTVLWKNNSDVPHTVTADPDKANNPAQSVKLPEGAETFDSGNMPAGDTYSRTFTVPGDYTYFCIPHEAAGMIGTLTVREGE